MRLRVPLYSDMMDKVRLLNGPELPISIQRVKDGDAPDLDFRLPRLVGKVRPSSMLKVGDIVEYMGEKFILSKRFISQDYKSFWMYNAERRVTWSRPTKVVDPVTNLPKSTGNAPISEIWVAWEMMARQPIDRQLGVSNEVNRVMTTEQVQLNDLLDGQQVKRVNDSMGVRIVEVQ